jgi:hypothetical protein
VIQTKITTGGEKRTLDVRRRVEPERNEGMKEEIPPEG